MDIVTTRLNWPWADEVKRRKHFTSQCKIKQNLLLVFSNSFTSVIFRDTLLTNHIDFNEVMETHNWI